LDEKCSKIQKTIEVGPMMWVLSNGEEEKGEGLLNYLMVKSELGPKTTFPMDHLVIYVHMEELINMRFPKGK
jgi:hypothetical protein